MGSSAWHILKKSNTDIFKRSFRIGLAFALIFSVFVIAEGHWHGALVGEAQPVKLAAMESHWETGTHVPLYLLQVPAFSGEGNAFRALGIPGFLSFLAHHDPAAEVKGLYDFPQDERPPVFLTFVAFRTMVALAFIFLGLSLYGWFRRNSLEDSPKFLTIMLYSIPLPYIANNLGWTVTEVGRQPWIVFGLQRTAEAVSPVSASQVAVSLAGFTMVYTIFGIIGFALMAAAIRKGPDIPETPGPEERDQSHA
jgi:cytochrome d ubiquinol oxidase subunit I